MLKSRTDVKTIVNDGNLNLRTAIALFLGKRWLFIAIVGIAFIFSLYRAFTTSEEFLSESKLLLETSSSSGNVSSALSGLAGLAGINVNSHSAGPEGLEPTLYPKILESEIFLLELAEERFYINELRDTVDLVTFFSFNKNKNNKNKKPLRKKVNRPSIDRVSISTINNDERAAITQLEERISLKLDGRFVELAVKMPEPRLSAEVNQRVAEKLIRFIVDYKTAKRIRDTKFIQERTEEAKRNYLNAQSGLASYKDRNIGLLFQAGRSREEQLQNQYNLYFNLYNTLAAQLEQSRIKLKEETPVFTQLNPVSVPELPDEPKRVRIILLYTAFGIFLGFLAVLMSLFIDYLR